MPKAKPGTGRVETHWPARMLFQGWVSIAFWMAFGLLLESFLAYKIPGYLMDAQRRELLRLAHAHGTLLGIVLIVAALCVRQLQSRPARAIGLALQIGAVLLPSGFLLAGIWHPEGDPGIAIWLVPPGALLVIFGAIAMALALRKLPNPEN
jgi:hypothetical protein